MGNMNAQDFKVLMLEMYNELMEDARTREGRFFQNMFTNEFTSDTEKVQLDVQRSVRLIAEDVKRGSGVSNQNYSEIFTNEELEVPLFSEETPITARMLNKRIPGINPYTPTGRMEALAHHVAQAQAFHANKVLNAMEKMAVECLTTGIVLLKNTKSLDFKKKATLTYTPSTKWDQNNAPFETDVETICSRIHQAGKRKPTIAIFDKVSFGLFLDRVAEKYNNTPPWMKKGLLDQGPVMPGATYQGTYKFTGFNLDIYVADDFYEVEGATINDPTTKAEYMPTETIIFLDPTIRLTKGFAAVEIIPQFEEEYARQGLPTPPQFVEAKFYPFLYTKPPAALVAGVQCSPLLMPTAIDCIGTIVDTKT